MKKTLAFLVSIVLAMLACNVQVPTIQNATATALPTLLPSATKLPTVTKTWMAEVKLPTVNIRESPDGKVIDSLSAGDKVTILECSRTWCKIMKPRGYIWRGCLSDNPTALGCQAK